MAHSFASLNVHLVFSVKDRAPLITASTAERLYPYLGGLARTQQSPALAIGGMPDHVHLLVGISRELALADFVRDLKANSSKWIHQTFPDQSRFAWQGGYGAFSVSQSNVDGVRRYIARQQEHHRVRTFQEEYRALLERHGIAFDERYLWA